MTGSEFRPQLRLLLVQAPRSPGYPAWQPLSQLDLHHLSSCGTLRDPCSPRPPPVLVPGLPLELGVRLPKVPLYLSLSSLPPPWLKLKPQPLRGLRALQTAPSHAPPRLWPPHSPCMSTACGPVHPRAPQGAPSSSCTAVPSARNAFPLDSPMAHASAPPQEALPDCPAPRPGRLKVPGQPGDPRPLLLSLHPWLLEL